MIDINFSILCTIEISHEYYGNKPWSDFTIIPSQQTFQILGNCKMIYRQQAEKLIIGIQSEVVDSSVSPPVVGPFIIPPVDQPLTFFIKCNNPYFSNFTNIPLAGLNGKLFYFTNRNSNAVHNGSNSMYYLSNTIKPYSNPDNYSEGDMVVSAGTVYSAVQVISQTSPVDPPNSDYWRIINSSNIYVSQNDLLQLIPAIYNYPLGSTQTSATYQVNGYNDVATPHDYSAVIIPRTAIAFPASNSFKLDLSSLPAGKYDLIINDHDHNIVYLNNELTGTGNYCGVIELYNDGTLPAGYSYLDNNGNLLSSPKIFSIYFLNRATIWKYILRASSQGTITMAGFNFPTIAGNPIYSLSSIPLSEIQPIVNLTGIEIDDQLQTVPFTNQSVARASANCLNRNVEDLSDTHYYSEIYLNY